MLRITLDINGFLIGEIGVWNREEYNEEGEVRYSVYDLQTEEEEEAEHIEEYEHLFDLWHHRSYGASSLSSVVLEELSEDQLQNTNRG